jgi:predicted RNase H-like nuclease (RuvC/YqgF family)
MENTNRPYEPVPEESNGWKIATAIFGVLFLAAVVFGGVFYSKYNHSFHHATDLSSELENTKTQLQGELSTLNTQYSGQIAINDTLSSDLKAKVAEVEDLQVRIAQARKELKTSQANNAEIKNRLAQMEDLKVALEKDIENLKAENSTLAKGNADLNLELTQTKDQVATLNTQVMTLTSANEKLTSRLKTIAPAGFRADNFTVTSETKNNKITSKGKKIDEITVSFDLNNIPEEFQGNREIYLVLTEFNGNPVEEVPGKDVNLQIGDTPVKVHAADLEKVNLKGRQNVKMSFEPSEDLTPGTYNLMVYADNGYLGSTGFLVSK